jgi:hypothetical protein
MKSFPKSVFAYLFLVSNFAAAAHAQAPAVCPWLSVGTASTALESEVTAAVHSDNNWSGSFLFTTTIQHDIRSLEILVGKSDPHACPPGSTALTAIGNQAWRCQTAAAQKQIIDIVTGRVRDAWFVVKMTNVPDASKPESDVPHGSDRFGAPLIEKIAEQVSGSLF